MAAGVVEGADHAVGAADDDDRVEADIPGDVVAGLRVVPGGHREQPARGDDALKVEMGIPGGCRTGAAASVSASGWRAATGRRDPEARASSILVVRRGRCDGRTPPDCVRTRWRLL